MLVTILKRLLNYLFSLNSFLSFYLKSIPNLTQKIPLLALFLR
ncbi:hypothetical protein HPHPP25_1471 [Helicobacter pylori Hp P-25]|uniref:Uncharacterized protein n=1 Tax=Helicobacter pylori Hp P-4 TaxID=992075 RepID=J0PUM3_HELPX|nr:hypothetical protein HPHPA20_0683 [Helicobacter pylori Hp A-20]EJB53898.1 hypothetical protein HPHPH27_0522 [Helicobacter pylori Hp H-27]EJB92790.1 hypothetical protein HPHPH21_0849 [Helicobacter pylori Hp H-21]EJB95284.1 hypothetical protein HPHPP1_1317 [Helicobacter pylori Hp P-1]EJC02336.1 hypothetical protein HPHPP4_1135 [Helicobacter pylori Hp P-4]EJC11840.1 hypothetical protein HPHPP25_1471 [Helicobacter pylori Hp P-25]EJC15855.1 hypothetical protein HPHPP74_0656 [Helicobacter pylori